jgi:hypothetical protein
MPTVASVPTNVADQLAVLLSENTAVAPAVETQDVDATRSAGFSIDALE